MSILIGGRGGGVSISGGERAVCGGCECCARDGRKLGRGEALDLGLRLGAGTALRVASVGRHVRGLMDARLCTLIQVLAIFVTTLRSGKHITTCSLSYPSFACRKPPKCNALTKINFLESLQRKPRFFSKIPFQSD